MGRFGFKIFLVKLGFRDIRIFLRSVTWISTVEVSNLCHKLWPCKVTVTYISWIKALCIVLNCYLYPTPNRVAIPKTEKANLFAAEFAGVALRRRGLGGGLPSIVFKVVL